MSPNYSSLKFLLVSFKTEVQQEEVVLDVVEEEMVEGGEVGEVEVEEMEDEVGGEGKVIDHIQTHRFIAIFFLKLILYFCSRFCHKNSRGGGGRGGGGRGRGGMKGGAKVIVEPHRHEGIFVARGKEDALVTKNSTPGISVYGEKRISVEATTADGAKVEYRVWNPFRSKLAAAVLGGVDDIWIKPGYKVLYLGAAAGTSVSHVSDIVGPDGCVYDVEFSHRPGRDLINMAKARTNVIPIIEVRENPTMKVAVFLLLEKCTKKRCWKGWIVLRC